MDSIRWIFFDIGGVLFDESRFTEWRLKNNLSIIQKYRPEFTHDDLMDLLSEASATIGSLDTSLIQIALRGTGFEAIALSNLRESKKTMPNYYDWGEVRNETMEVLKVLSQKYKLGIMAYQNQEAKVKLREAGILGYFKHTEVSDDYHLEKPNPEFFQCIFESTGANPRESVIIDDNIERGLVPAKSFGMTTVWYQIAERTTTPKNTIDYTISSLKNLLKIF